MNIRFRSAYHAGAVCEPRLRRDGGREIPGAAASDHVRF